MSKQFSKTTTIIILSFLALLALGLACVIFVLSQQDNNLNWDTIIKRKQPPIVYEELKTEMDTREWLTYRNEKLGFEFKYPKNWEEPEVDFTEGPDPNKKLFRIVIFSGDREASMQGGEIYSIESKNDLNQNIEALRKSIVGDLNDSEKIELFNGKAFYSKVPNTAYGETPSADIVSKQYLLTLAMLYDTADSMTLEELFKKIIATFRFYQ